MNYSLRTPHAPDYTMSVREILEAENRFSDETLDRMERLDSCDSFHGWDMGGLISYANRLEMDYRRQARDELRQKAARRLCRIIAMQYTRALVAGYCGECERLAEALDVATREWCNG